MGPYTNDQQMLMRLYPPVDSNVLDATNRDHIEGSLNPVKSTRNREIVPN